MGYNSVKTRVSSIEMDLRIQVGIDEIEGKGREGKVSFTSLTRLQPSDSEPTQTVYYHSPLRPTFARQKTISIRKPPKIQKKDNINEEKNFESNREQHSIFNVKSTAGEEIDIVFDYK